MFYSMFARQLFLNARVAIISFVLLGLGVASTAEAGGTVSVNVGSPMPMISWNLDGVASCSTGTTYPNIADGIRAFWVSMTPASTGSSNFGGRIVQASANLYEFSCVNGSVSDTTYLRVCNNVTEESDGGSLCVPKVDTIKSANFGEPMPLITWDVSGAPFCNVGSNYPPIADGVKSFWSLLGSVASVGSSDFGGLTIGATPTSNGRPYAFWCASGTAYDGTGLRVCDNVTEVSDGLSGCVPKLPGPNLKPLASVDLSVGDAATLREGDTIRFSAQTLNNGTAATGAFTSSFLYCWGVGCTPTIPFGFENYPAGLAAGASTPVQLSDLLTLSGFGVLGVSFVVDSGNAIGESVDTDNVSTRYFNVAPNTPSEPTALSASTPTQCGGYVSLSWSPVSGATRYEVSPDGGTTVVNAGAVTTYLLDVMLPNTLYNSLSVRAVNASGYSNWVERSARSSPACAALAGVGCTIAEDASTCAGAVTWDLSGSVAPRVMTTYGTPAVETEFSTSPTGNLVSITLDHGSTTVEGRDGSEVLVTRTLSAVCGGGFFFYATSTPGMSMCKPDPVLSFTPNLILVRADSAALITLQIVSESEVTCTIIGNIPGSPVTINHFGTAASPTSTHNIATNVITSTQVVRVSCTAPGLSEPRVQDVRINMVPRNYEEI